MNWKKILELLKKLFSKHYSKPKPKEPSNPPPPSQPKSNTMSIVNGKIIIGGKPAKAVCLLDLMVDDITYPLSEIDRVFKIIASYGVNIVRTIAFPCN